MLYIKPDEVNAWAPRTPVDDEGLAAMAAISSAMAESYVGRSLAISDYKYVVSLSPGLGGYIGPVPIVSVSKLRVRRSQRTIGGGRAASPEGWVDLGVDSIETLLDFANGRLELYTFQWDGYQRFTASRRDARCLYQAEVTFRSGYFPATELDVAATTGDQSIAVVSSSGLLPGMKITVGPYSRLYTIADVEGTSVLLTEALEADVEVGDEVAGRVPNDLKAACGAIVEDLQTWTPTSESMSNTLSIIKETTKRTSGHPIPPAAAALLAKYKRWSWV